MAKAEVSICIVSWNTRELLEGCLASIFSKTRDVVYEIIVIDNHSTDGSAEMVESKFPACKLIKSDNNIGFVKANNLAVKFASGNYVLYLNPDTELVTNAIYGMKKFLDAHLDYGAVGCRLVYADGRIQFVCARAFPTPFRQFCYLSLLEKIFPKAALFSSIEMRYWDHQNNSDIDCLSGACILARKEIVDELKGFDENLFMYAEDVDLCYRIKEAGWKIYYLYEDVILHYGGSSSKKTDRKYFSTLLQRESNYYFHQKHYGENRAKEYLFAVLIGSLFRIFVVLGATPVILCSERVRQKIPPDAIIKYSLLSKWALKTLLVGIERKSKSPAQA